MVFLQEPISETQPVAEIIRTVIIAALTILIALSIREFLITLMYYIMPEPQANRLVFQGFIAAFVIFLTIVIASIWK